MIKLYEGKPWAQISYHKSFSMAMGMVRGFVADLAAAFLLIWLLMKIENRNLVHCVARPLAVGLVGCLAIPCRDSIWFEKGLLGYLIDSVGQ